MPSFGSNNHSGGPEARELPPSTLGGVRSMDEDRIETMMLRSPSLALWIVALLVMGPSSASAQEPARPDAFRSEVLPLLERYCVDCHSTEDAEAGIALDRFRDQAAAVEDGKTWPRVL